MYLYGAGGHARVVMDVLSSQHVKIFGFFDDTGNKTFHENVPVYPGIKLSSKALPILDAPLIICIGDNAERAKLSSLLNINFGTAIDKSSLVSQSAEVGKGSVILHGAIVQANTIIGKHVIINTGARIDHESVIEDFAHISPNATLCGKVHIGEGSHIGAGATIIPGIKIGKWCVVGAGTVVIRDVPDFTTAVGNPARLLADKVF